MMNLDTLQECAFSIADFKIASDDIQRAMGYDQERQAPEALVEMINVILKEIYFLRPDDIRGGFKIFPAQNVFFGEDRFSCGDVAFEAKTAISSCLCGSTQLAVFIVTAGHGVERLIKKYMNDGELLMSFCVDTYGSLIAEQLAERIHIAIKETAAAQGFKITNRYSPGYCHWDVREQHKLFSLMPNDFCGVRLTDSALMVPRKSVSGVVGIGEQAQYRAHACAFCEIDDCLLREKREEQRQRRRNHFKDA